MKHMKYKIAILGAFNPIGKSLLSVLYDSPLDKYDIYALDGSHLSHETIEFGETFLPIIPAIDFNFKHCITFLCSSHSISKYKKKALSEKSILIYCTDTQPEKIPYIVPYINKEQITSEVQEIGSPLSPSIFISLVTHVIHQKYHIGYLQATILLSTSEFGESLTETLASQTRHVYTRKPLLISPNEKPLPFNVIPEFNPHYSQKINQQILHLTGISASVSSILVPVFIGDTISLTFTCHKPVSSEDIEHTLEQNPLFKFFKDESISPTDTVGNELFYVSHLRQTGPQTYSLWITGDNLQAGMLLNAVNTAQVLIDL